MLLCDQKIFYVGITDNIERRIQQHNTGRNKTTRPYCSFTLVTTEIFYSRIEARQREKYFKSGEGREYIKRHLVK